LKAKIIIPLSLFALLLFSAVGYLWYENTYQSVTLVFKTQPLTVEVLDSSNKPVATVSTSATLTLANGNYSAKPSGRNIDSTPIKFSVDGKDMSVTINPSFSNEYFSGLIKTELEAINSIIVKRYPQLISKYTIHVGELQQQAEWYVTALTHKKSNNDNPKDAYKIILKKMNGVWDVVNSPQIVPTIYNMPGVPGNVISAAYNFTPRS
jgi:hypothetical protein